SLVAVELEEDDEEEDARYRLLETVRVYAVDRLTAAGEEAATRDRHRDHYLGMAQEAEVQLEGPLEPEWTGRLARDYPNIRAALEWSHKSGDFDRVASSSAALSL